MASAIPLSRYRFSMDQFQGMARAGILAENARIELIDGDLIDMAPVGSRHGSVVALLTRWFVQQGGDVVVWSQSTIDLSPFSAPQPDIAILAPQTRAYRDALPDAEDVLLVVEVAESSLRYDRLVKAELYARHGIREFWLMNLPERMLEIHRDPEIGAYRTRSILSGDDTASPEACPQIRVPLAPLLSD